MCWTTSREVRRAGLQAGRFVEAGPRAGRDFYYVFIYDLDFGNCKALILRF